MKVENGQAVFDSPEEEAAFKALSDAQIAGLKAKNSELLGDLAKLKPLKDIDVNEYKTLKEQAAQIEADKQKLAGDWDAREKSIMEAHAKAIKERDDKLSAKDKTLEKLVLVDGAKDAILAEKGRPNALMHHVQQRMKLDESGSPVVVDDAGNTRYGADGKPMTARELVAEMKSDVDSYGWGFERSGANGSGQQPSNGGGNDLSKLSLTELAQRQAEPAVAAYIKTLA